MVWKIIPWLFTWYEAWTDRKGEKKKRKLTDSIILIAGSALYFTITWKWMDQNPLILTGYTILWRVTTFDYINNWFLKKYSPTHKEKNINIWKYMGSTTYWWDQLVGKVNWIIRLIVRFILLCAGVWYL